MAEPVTDAIDTEPPDHDLLDDLRQLHERATAGPWGWRGHDDGQVELIALHSGYQRVVTTLRARPCIVTLDDGDWALTIDACPACCARAAEVETAGNVDRWEGYRCPQPENLGTLWLHDSDAHIIRPANTWATREQPYRPDVSSVDHPDALLITAARNALPVLLDELDQRRAEATALRAAFRLPDDLDAAGLAPADGWRAFCAEIWRPPRTPRSDTLRNRLAATRELLATVADELGDLHVLAYERQTLTREVAVAGGQADYALDTHGDIRARDAYRELGRATVHAVDVLDHAAAAVVRLLRAGDPPNRARSRRIIHATDLADAIVARARRLERGEYEPVRREPQPEVVETMRALRADLERARKEIERRPTDDELQLLAELLDHLDPPTPARRRWAERAATDPWAGHRKALRAAIRRARPPEDDRNEGAS